MINILYIHQYFKTPEEPGGTRSYWIAKELIKKGYQVTMLTSSNKLANKIELKKIEGINVIYIGEKYDQKMSVFRRIFAYFNFMLKSTTIALKQKNIDLVIATSTPLTIGFPALVLSRFKKIPYVFEVRDLWPEVPIQMGGLKNKFVQRLAVLFERTIYKNAKHIIALSPGMKEGVLKYVSEDKVSMIPNMSKKDEFWPRTKDNALMNELGLKSESFKIIHFGSLGIANGAMTIIDSARILKDDSTVEFIFLGGGATEASLRAECEKFNLSNVRFLGEFSMKQTSEIVNFCDVSIVSFMDLPILYTNSPNKLFDSLSAGKPVIVNSAGWTKDLVEQNNCGYYVNPNIPKELVDKIKYLQQTPHVVTLMGEESRKLALQNFDKSILCKEFVNVIQKQHV
ncbi:glycosyltransferase family 4 protein [Flavobacterium sp. LAR06]|uniref:glycosyltransferase family 4 protein n=1 Tax=Flavobacterium sp. LAR06 TaxID=3064897 RepID=UPI0035C00216